MIAPHAVHEDLVRELGGAFGIGALGTLTLSHYRSGFTPTLSGEPAAVSARS